MDTTPGPTCAAAKNVTQIQEDQAGTLNHGLRSLTVLNARQARGLFYKPRRTPVHQISSVSAGSAFSRWRGSWQPPRRSVPPVFHATCQGSGGVLGGLPSGPPQLGQGCRALLVAGRLWQVRLPQAPESTAGWVSVAPEGKPAGRRRAGLHLVTGAGLTRWATRHSHGPTPSGGRWRTSRFPSGTVVHSLKT